MARVLTLGRADYREVWALQQQLVTGIAAGEVPATVILVEHEPVYTVGRRRAAAANVLDPGEVPVVEVERGGDVTWHGPGQLVIYPLLKLPVLDLHAHLHRLEDLMITLCAGVGLDAGRDPRNTGAWIGGRKVGSVGIACRRGVTWHGLALNVCPDLGYFARIHPCGFDASIMTSLEREKGAPVSFAAVHDAAVGIVEGW